ncbi:MAG: pyridoxal phosphate-dependent aminotransferase [Bacteroidales bacterium]|nr:pyridoxal phosphate-dependent aminotransferase [Bacteroidales bacterium]
MPSISIYAELIPQSAIRMLTPFADKAEADGITVYHLNIGAPDIKSPESAPKAVREFQFDHLPYSNSAGTLSLRKALVEKYYAKLGIDITPDEIIVTNGGSEGVHFALMTVCDKDDEVLVMEPFYCNYSTFAALGHLKFVTVPTDIRDGFKLPKAEEFEKRITPRTKALLICNPSNPTGTLYTKKEMLALGELCRKHDLFLISDEVYREFCYTDAPHFSAMHIPGLEQHVILLDSASKRYNLCGARIGCIISRNHEVMDFVTRLAQARLCPPVLGQVATYGALEADESYFAAVRREYKARRDFTIAALNNIPGVYTPTPMGAFYTLAELPVPDAQAFCKWMLTDFHPDGETVMLTPAAAFYKTPGAGMNQVRVAYVLEIPRLQRAMKVLEAGLEEYRKINNLL